MQMSDHTSRSPVYYRTALTVVQDLIEMDTLNGKIVSLGQVTNKTPFCPLTEYQIF